MKKLLFLLILLIPLVLAHQPRIVADFCKSDNFEIQNPEISQAFYGELDGTPDFYKINSDKNFTLYLNILSPDIPLTRKDFSVDLSYGNVSLTLNSSTIQWGKFYEEYAGDSYWKGPELEFQAPLGEYKIKVSNPTNQGKYVLAVGKIESFTAKESFNTLILMPRLKRYFEKGIFAVFQGKIGKYLLITVIVLAIILYLIIHYTRKFISSRISYRKISRRRLKKQ